jgi:hypothetical protein
MFHKANLPPQSPADVAGLHAATAESSTVTKQNLPPSPVPPGWTEISGSGNRQGTVFAFFTLYCSVPDWLLAGVFPKSLFNCLIAQLTIVAQVDIKVCVKTNILCAQ